MKLNVSKNKAVYSKSFISRLGNDLYRNKVMYLMVLPALLFYFIFAYRPMYGAIIAFKDYTPSLGIEGSPWVGLKHIKEFFESFYFVRTIKNTVVISLASIFIGFPMPIVFALLLNELRSKKFAKCVQTVSYVPHFISVVVVCGMVKQFTMDNGLINDIIAFFGGTRVSMLNEPAYFVPVYTMSNIWQGMGWQSIIYLAALTAVDPSLYEAAEVDGASRLRQVFTVTLPAIAPTIVTMFLLKIGNILNIGYEKIILLYNPATYETADVISSFVYRKGLLEFNWSYSSAIGLFNSAINLVLLVLSNYASKRIADTSLW